MKTKPEQWFTSKQLFEIHIAAQNLASTAMFEAGINALGGDRYVGQNEGALGPHMEQLLKVLPVKFILQSIAEQEKQEKDNGC